MSIGLVILNYNSSDMCIDLVKNISNYENIDVIVVVDNASKIEEVNKLKKSDLKKTIIIYNNVNRGYAAGNNIGLKYLVDHNVEYCFIVNPDVIVKKDTIDRIANELASKKDLAVCSSIRTDINNKFTQRQFWNLPDYHEMLSNCTILGRKKYKKQYVYRISNISSFMYVDVVPGSFFGIKSSVLKEIEFLDEDTFLYFEENCLAAKLKSFNYREGLVLDSTYIHNHIPPTQKANGFIVFKRGYESRNFYRKKYINPSCNLIEKFFLSFMFRLSLLERKIVSLLFHK